MKGIDWATISMVAMAVVAVGGVVTGVARAAIRHTLRLTFASVADLKDLSQRLAQVEQRIAAIPSHQDIAALRQQLTGLERTVAVTDEAVRGIRDGLGRVEHMMGLLVQAELEKEKGADQ